MKEHQQLEWKETRRDEFLSWIRGFANAEGGVLHIGRNNKGKVAGVPGATIRGFRDLARTSDQLDSAALRSSKAALREHLSTPFNPAVASPFFRFGEIEPWGRGIQRIFAVCREGNHLSIEFPYAPEYLKAVAFVAGEVAAPVELMLRLLG